MVENWSAEEENAVAEFRDRMKGDVPQHMYDDKHMFYKFLKARNFNLQNAESMLRKHLVWRKELQIDSIITDFKPIEPLRKYVSQSFFGFSKEGHLLQYASIGNTDGKGVFKCANSADVMRCILQEIEKNIRRLKRQSEKLGRTINQCIYIYNMENMTFAKATHKSSIELFAIGVAMFQDNYPELLKDLYIINASVYFTIVFPIIKAIMSGALLNKIHVYGKDGWKEELLRVVDVEVLPAFLGGQRADSNGDPLCPAFINHAGDVPQHYYLTKNVQLLKEKPGSKKKRIDRQSKCDVVIEVANNDTRLHWEYETARYDIAFGLELRSLGGERVECIPVHKVETENGPERGFFTCKVPGTYVMTFDNSYSWFHAKDLYYRTWTEEETQNDDKELAFTDIII